MKTSDKVWITLGILIVSMGLILLVLSTNHQTSKENPSDFVSDPASSEDLSDDLPPGTSLCALIDGQTVVLEESVENETWQLLPTLLSWGSGIQLYIDANLYSLDKCRVIRTIVNAAGSRLLPENHIEIEQVDSDTINIPHSLWSGIWKAYRDSEDIFIRYTLAVPEFSGKTHVYRFIVKSEFPTFENSDLLSMLEGSLIQNKIQAEWSSEGDTNGDGIKETITLHITNDELSFITVDGGIVLCLKNCYYPYGEAKIEALDLDGDGCDEIAIVWGILSDFIMQCVAVTDEGWEELFLPPTVFEATMLPDFCMQLTYPNGATHRVSAAKLPQLSYYFDADGVPYSSIAEITCWQDPNYEIVFRDDQVKIAITGWLDLCAMGNYEGEMDTLKLTILEIPMYVSMEQNQLQFTYGDLDIFE